MLAALRPTAGREEAAACRRLVHVGMSLQYAARARPAFAAPVLSPRLLRARARRGAACRTRPLRVFAREGKPPAQARQPVAPTERSKKAGVPEDAALYLYELDAAGSEVRLESGYASKELAGIVAEGGVDDVVVVSHGWATQRKEGKVAFNHNLVRAMMVADPRLGERNVLYVGVHWPSHPVTALARGEKAASREYAARVDAAVRDVEDAADVADVEPKLAELEIDYPARFAEAEAQREERPDELIAVVEEELRKTDPKAAAKIGEVRAGLKDSDGVIDEGKVAEVDKLLDETDDSGSELDGALAGAEGAVVAKKEEKKTGGFFSFLKTDEIKLTLRSFTSNRDKIYALAALFGIPLPGKSLFASRMLLQRLERLLFGQFQRRAAEVGSRGVHVLLSEMMKAVPEGESTRFHLVGHSLGCHVVTAAAIGRGPVGSLLPRKVNSMTLLQAAVPCVNYEDGGPYRPLSSTLNPVAGPVIATTSQSDMALYNMEIIYPDVLGREGFRGVPRKEERTLLNKCDQELGFEKGKFYTVEADAVINATSGLLYVDLDGAHGDLLDVELQARVWEAIDTDVTDEDLRIPKKDELPPNYWEKDRTVRRKC